MVPIGFAGICHILPDLNLVLQVWILPSLQPFSYCPGDFSGNFLCSGTIYLSLSLSLSLDISLYLSLSLSHCLSVSLSFSLSLSLPLLLAHHRRRGTTMKRLFKCRVGTCASHPWLVCVDVRFHPVASHQMCSSSTH